MRFCQLRLKVVIARCPPARASGPWPKHGPHHDCADLRRRRRGTRRRSTRRSSRGSGRSICALHAARSREDHELASAPCVSALRARRPQHQRRRQQVVVAAVGARADHRLVEREPLARHLLGRERVAGAERLGDHRHDLAQLQRLVDLERRVGAAARITGRAGRSCPSPRYQASVIVVGREDAVLRLGLGHHVGDGVAVGDRQLRVRGRRTRPTCPATASRPSGAAARARCPCR